jgi:hypothetical protein
MDGVAALEANSHREVACDLRGVLALRFAL